MPAQRHLIHGIDLTAPGGLDALFAFNRARFGTALMMADEGGDSGDAGESAEGSGDQGTGEQDAGQGQAAGQSAWDGKVESLPSDVQKIIRDLRTEAGDERHATKTLTAIQRALNPEAGDEKPDAAKLAQQLAERETETAQTKAEAAQAKAELAVFRISSKTGADADALLDSRGFLAKLKDTDPSDTKALTALVEAAVKDNPKFRSVRAADRNGADFNGGSGEGSKSSTPVPLHQAVSGHYGSR